MNPEFATELLKTLMFEAVTLAAPILTTALVIGLSISLFQSVTSIQEQTLSFVPKALAKIGPTAVDQLPLKIVIPSFIISELRTAFQMGFLIFVPFILIDLIVATVLMSMGMMMMPPATISLPLKILLFVLVDGWHLIVSSIVQSFGS